MHLGPIYCRLSSAFGRDRGEQFSKLGPRHFFLWGQGEQFSTPDPEVLLFGRPRRAILRNSALFTLLFEGAKKSSSH